MKALSIRQPWAWMIANGHKDVENRTWNTHFRGEFLIHAAKGMTRDEYAIAEALAEDQGVSLPRFAELERGGIVGQAEITHCVSGSSSPWFFGPYGHVYTNPVEFKEPIPFKGALKYFDVPDSLIVE